MDSQSKLYFMAYVLSGYATTRTRDTENTRIYGYSHADSAHEAALYHKTWAGNLRAAFHNLPEADKDIEKIKAACIAFMAEHKIKTSPDVQKFIEDGALVAAGLSEPSRSSPGLGIFSSDHLQRPLQEWNF